MKERITDIVDGFFIFLLVVCSFQCLVSSFDININLTIVAVCVAMFTFVFALIAVSEKNTIKYFIILGVIFIVYQLLMNFLTDIIVEQLKYTVNSVLKLYSRYMVVPQSIGEISEKTDGATALFVVLSFPVCGLLTVFRMRLKKLLPVVATTIVMILPCFILVNTLPKLLPLFTVLVILFTMYIGSMAHHTNSDYTGVVSSVVAVLMSVVIVVVYIISPADQYERKQWQDDLLNITESALFERNSSLHSNESIRKDIDLSDIGPLEKTHTKVMYIKSPNSGIVYLKGVAYANYENNKWSILTREQLKKYPTDFNSATMTKSSNLIEETMKIKTVGKEGVIYTPYYLSSVPDFGTSEYDVLIGNYKEKINYEVNYKPFWVNEYFPTVDDTLDNNSGNYSFNCNQGSSFTNYKNYVYRNYCKLPEELKAEILEYMNPIMSEHFYGDDFLYLSTETIVEYVSWYVKKSASYSLDTPKVPQGTDISLWFLKESDTGYCTHFATATAVILRALDIPTRYVTGFCAYAKADTTTEITSDDAHAWVEYFDDEMGWVPIESTPQNFNISDVADSPTEPTAQEETKPTDPPTELQTEETTRSPKIIPAESDSDKPVKVFIAILNVLAVVIIIAVLAIIALLIRRNIVLKLRKRSFAEGDCNTRVKYLYRYILKTAKHSYVPVPDEIKSIAEKARFSNTTLSDDELDLVLAFTESREKQLMTEESEIKRLYFKYILVLA